MNQQRQQAYFNLIQNLLNCPSDQEPEILAANQELVDVGFLQTVEATGEMFLQQGDENTTNWLQGLASYLREVLNLNTTVDLQSLSEEHRQAYVQFLMEIMQATKSSWGDSKVVYPLLAKNTDKLDGVLGEILRQWAKNTLTEAEAVAAQSIAGDIVNFSNLIAQFPLGNKARNKEIAITGYEVALTLYTSEAFPQDWAMLQNNLGLAYSNRIRGERAENLEQAIAYHQEALKVRTFDAFPEDWATTQNNLAVAYSNRIRGERAENLEQAIAYLQEALKVYTFDTFPEDWAMMQNNLGLIYRERIRGERAEDLEQAIACFQKALKVYTFDAFPQDWAMMQNNLAVAYLERIRGEWAENLEQAIAYLQKVLKVKTFGAFPQDWAMLQNNLALAYSKRIRGERAENLEQAIAYFQE
ncbi:tetratricopeptide repeat protein, partial [Nostoc sp. KVJ20]|uniref:tetratricopeptide repeat protein n=1 Tax=Nostoc sp. KVJ20 TaxID=457944 RepID=UPI000B1CF946